MDIYTSTALGGLGEYGEAAKVARRPGRHGHMSAGLDFSSRPSFTKWMTLWHDGMALNMVLFIHPSHARIWRFHDCSMYQAGYRLKR